MTAGKTLLILVLALFLSSCGIGSGGGEGDSSGGSALPSDFPLISVLTSNNPAPGYIYLTNLITTADPGSATYAPYIMILDNAGAPVFFRKIDSSTAAFDFKIQPNGETSFFTAISIDTTNFFTDGFLTAMDSDYRVTRTVRVPDGDTDMHDSIMLSTGHTVMLSYQDVTMDLTRFGGSPSAIVTDIEIVEIDRSGFVVFRWKGRDHFEIDETSSDINLGTLPPHKIDYVHGNSLALDLDDNLLLSCRHLDQVLKIDHVTGDIIWRLGGKKNEFIFVDDSFGGFSHQHQAYRLPNGNLLLFDNGNLHNPALSRAIEYQLDEISSPKTAKIVWQYTHNPPIFSKAMGSVQRLANRNTLIGWGTISNPAVTEVRPDGTTALEMSMPSGNFSYRAFKFER